MQPLASDDPSCIGPYRLLGRLGAGGMGRVYLARPGDGSPGGADTVAVKLVRPELAQVDDFRRRFAREVRAARRVDGRWTAPVLDADTEAEVPWVATAYVPGPTLHAVVRGDFGPLPSASAHVLANRMGLALRGIHAAGLVHRDLKPSNVLLTVDGPRVIDFGIAHALDASPDSTITPRGVLVGSPEYMSPEQVRGDGVVPASDVFSLGCVLAYAATGRSPFAGEEGSGVHGLLFRIAYEEPDLSGVPEALVDLVRECLAKDPAERPSVTGVVDRTRLAPPGGWLPEALLTRLDRAASKAVPDEPQRLGGAAPGAGASKGAGSGSGSGSGGAQPVELWDMTGEFTSPFPVDPLLPVDPLDVPESGIRPPHVRVAPVSRRTRVSRRVTAGVVGVAAAASLGVGGYLVSDAVDAWHDGEKQTVTAQGPAARPRFAGTWLAETDGGKRQLRLDIASNPRKGAQGAEFVSATEDGICVGASLVLGTADGRWSSTLTLGEHNVRWTVPARLPHSRCGLGTQLKLRSDESGVSIPGTRPDSQIILQRSSGSESGLDPAYTGLWRSSDRRWSVTVQPGDYGSAMVTGTETVQGGECLWSAVVLDQVDQHLVTTANQVRRMGDHPRCRTGGTAYTYVRESGSFVLVSGKDRQERTVLHRV
ncbi:serine/threonine-protein kinase [Streptomyces longispororuber]|uniref:serine/threonine-protein kinase n=1 Tax=Streptomyces longispororuber TaxID=68230 RepID=UPI00210BB63E|nr:serine/threonine-protein kinase [Streptomyces longispororuber]MCQ4214147.1 serine/threonine protein kinase [Streptomyces longispororuber]